MTIAWRSEWPEAVLALDIDGVLHRDGAERGELGHLPTLEGFLRRHPGVGVVISSDWRFLLSLPELVDLFAPDLRDRVMGVTPDLCLSVPVAPAARQREIEAWMAAKGLRTPWVALDDMRDGFEPVCPHLVCVTWGEGGDVGLSPVLLERVASILRSTSAGEPNASPPTSRFDLLVGDTSTGEYLAWEPPDVPAVEHHRLTGIVWPRETVATAAVRESYEQLRLQVHASEVVIRRDGEGRAAALVHDPTAVRATPSGLHRRHRLSLRTEHCLGRDARYGRASL